MAPVVVRTRQGVRYRLNGALTRSVRFPQWRYIKNMRGLVIFHNTQTRGWAWLSNGAKHLRSVKVSLLIQGGLTAEIYTTTRVRLTVSQAYAPGWYAYVYQASKLVAVVPAARQGVIQSYLLPAGFSRVRLLYQPPLVMWGMTTTMAGIALLISIAIMARRSVKYTFTDPIKPAP